MSATQALPDGPLLTFYGDDFTGSSAVMEVTAFAGLPTVLFLNPPTPEQLAQPHARIRLPRLQDRSPASHRWRSAQIRRWPGDRGALTSSTAAKS
jgi:uncharacterized protein YgbK (DUF1537 family)